VRGAGELHGQVRSGFERARGQQEAYAAKYSLSDGRAQLKMLSTAKHVALPAHCLAGVPEPVRSYTRVAASQHL